MSANIVTFCCQTIVPCRGALGQEEVWRMRCKPRANHFEWLQKLVAHVLQSICSFIGLAEYVSQVALVFLEQLFVNVAFGIDCITMQESSNKLKAHQCKPQHTTHIFVPVLMDKVVNCNKNVGIYFTQAWDVCFFWHCCITDL